MDSACRKLAVRRFVSEDVLGWLVWQVEGVTRVARQDGIDPEN